MPQKSQIAFYWHEKARAYFNFHMDWGEPECWACGYWNSYYPDIEDPKTEIDYTFQVWNKHPYLERCHIIPKAHGGCNCEPNLVLLCKACHKASPDTLNAILFQTWVKNRASWFTLSAQQLQQVIEELSYEPDERDHIILLSKGFRQYVLKSAIPVGGRLALSTMFACLIEFKAMVSEGELKRIYDEFGKRTVRDVSSVE